MKLILAIAIVFIAFIYIAVYALCKAASNDDRERERMSRTYDDDDYFEADVPK